LPPKIKEWRTLMNKNIFTYSFALVSSMTVLATEAQQTQTLMSQALTGKLAYMEGNYQAAESSLVKVLWAQPDKVLYLHYIQSTLNNRNTDEVFPLTEHLIKETNDSFYRKGLVFLKTRYEQLPGQADLDLLSKDDWYEFFSLLPAQDRIIFLEKLYKPEMIGSSSTRSFIAEIFLLLDLHQEAADLILFPTENLNSDLIEAAQRILTINQQRAFFKEYGDKVNTQYQQDWLQAVALCYNRTPIPIDLQKKFLTRHAHAGVVASLIHSGQFFLAQAILEKEWISSKDKALFAIEIKIERFELQEAQDDLKNYRPKSSDGYKLALAKYHYKTQEYEKSFQALADISDPEKAKEALLLRAKILLKVEPKGALMMLGHFQQKRLYPQSDLAFMQAIALMKLGYSTQAIALLERLYAQDPGYSKGAIVLAQLYLTQSNDPHTAQKILTQHFDQDNLMNGRAAMVMAESYMMLGDYKQAQRLALKAVELKPSEEHKEKAQNILKVCALKN